MVIMTSEIKSLKKIMNFKMMDLIKFAFITFTLLLTSPTLSSAAPDTTLPSIVVYFPHNGQIFTTSTIYVIGTASDNIGIGKVEIKVGSGIWQTALGTNSWSKSVTLAEGLNTIYLRATDTSGNSKETSIAVTYNRQTSSAIQINSDKTISINGTKTFPVYLYDICNEYFESENMIEPCNPSKNSEFLFSGSGFYYQDFTSYDYQNKFEQAKVFYNLFTSQFNDIPQNLKDSPYFFGYYQPDEPSDDNLDFVSTTYDNVKKNDPSHPVILNHWRNMSMWAPYTDIITWDTYPIRKNYVDPSSPGYIFPREDGIYAYEHYSEQNFFKGEDLNSINKPVWAVLQATGIPDSEGTLPLTNKEIRAMTYTAITMDVKGIGYWSYAGWGGSSEPTPSFPNGTPGLYNNATVHAYYKQTARELTSLNSILVLPTTDYSWDYRYGNIVTFSKNPSKTVLWKTRYAFNYILKNSGNTRYLIVVNKDSSPITDVSITIYGITGAMKATTLGLETSGSGRAGRVLSGNNGQFTDSFDGYAVHIYKVETVTRYY